MLEQFNDSLVLLIRKTEENQKGRREHIPFTSELLEVSCSKRSSCVRAEDNDPKPSKTSIIKQNNVAHIIIHQTGLRYGHHSISLSIHIKEMAQVLLDYDRNPIYTP